MSTRITLAEARSQLYRVINPDDANDADFLWHLNLVCERLINSGKWKGTKGVVDFASSEDGLITLPRQYSAVLGVDINCSPVPIFGQYHEYLEMGPGQIDESSTLTTKLTDAGEVPTMNPITEDGILRLTRANVADAAKTVRLYGKDENGDEIYDSNGDQGVTLTLASATNDTTQTFSEITGVNKQATVGNVTLSVVVDGTATELSVYRPTETVPLYRRYKVGITENPIRCLCKRRFVPLVDETDFVIPGNLNALRLGLIASYWETKYDLERAELYWKACFQALDDELREARGGINIRVNIDPGRRVANRY